MKTKMMMFEWIVPVLLLIGCSTGPNMIKGRVVMKVGTELHVDVGPGNGVWPGDTLNVVRLAGPRENSNAGKVKVLESLGRNASTVEVIEGYVQEGDLVEKESSPPPRKETLEGSIVMADSSGAHIDLGKDQGLVLGDTLIVSREEPITGHQLRRVRMGIVRVAGFVDRKYSQVEVLEGSVREGDHVELSARE